MNRHDTMDLTAVPPDVGQVTGEGLQVHAVVERDQFRLDVDFAVGPAEVMGVLGPNGAGKTTLLRALAGLTALTDGRISLDGEPLDAGAAGVFVAAEQRPIGLVFQNYRLFPHLCVRDNVAFAPRSRGAGRRASRQIADGWLDRMDLTDLAARKPAQLSGGQAQRVALARALAANPQLLLLDEPLAALDARTKLEIRAELRRHLADFPGPTLFVTHDPLEAMIMADQLIVIEHGRVVQRGTPAAVARRPATQYIARLVGLNLYTGTQTDANKITLSDGGTITAATTEPAAGPVLVAVRPTAIALHTRPPDHASPRNVWPGTISGLELLTDRVRVQVEGTPSALVDVTPDAVAELDLANGLPVWLSVKATDVEVYPAPAPSG
jgi:molybdate transport system ATP-binding protein